MPVEEKQVASEVALLNLPAELLLMVFKGLPSLESTCALANTHSHLRNIFRVDLDTIVEDVLRRTVPNLELSKQTYAACIESESESGIHGLLYDDEASIQRHTNDMAPVLKRAWYLTQYVTVASRWQSDSEVKTVDPHIFYRTWLNCSIAMAQDTCLAVAKFAGHLPILHFAQLTEFVKMIPVYEHRCEPCGCKGMFNEKRQFAGKKICVFMKTMIWAGLSHISARIEDDDEAWDLLVNAFRDGVMQFETDGGKATGRLAKDLFDEVNADEETWTDEPFY